MIRCLTYTEHESPTTRPPLVLPERDGCRAEWLCNARGGDVVYWAARNELAAAILRKRYMQRLYLPDVVFVAEPRRTAYTVETLIEQGLVGVYGWRRC